jgi:hypothetical protein
MIAFVQKAAVIYIKIFGKPVKKFKERNVLYADLFSAL